MDLYDSRTDSGLPGSGLRVSFSTFDMKTPKTKSNFPRYPATKSIGEDPLRSCCFVLPAKPNGKWIYFLGVNVAELRLAGEESGLPHQLRVPALLGPDQHPLGGGTAEGFGAEDGIGAPWSASVCADS